MLGSAFGLLGVGATVMRSYIVKVAHKNVAGSNLGRVASPSELETYTV